MRKSYLKNKTFMIGTMSPLLRKERLLEDTDLAQETIITVTHWW